MKYSFVDCNGLSDETFSTVKAVESFIAKKAKDQVCNGWLSEMSEGRNDDWGETHTIVSVIKDVKPIPIVRMKLKVEVEEVE